MREAERDDKKMKRNGDSAVSFFWVNKIYIPITRKQIAAITPPINGPTTGIQE